MLFVIKDVAGENNDFSSCKSEHLSTWRVITQLLQRETSDVIFHTCQL